MARLRIDGDRWLRRVRPAVPRHRRAVADFERRRPSAKVARDGRELFFVTNDRKFYAVAVRASDGVEFSSPHYLFEMPSYTIGVRNSYVPSRDGQRFLINKLLDTTVSPIYVDLDWAATVRSGEGALSQLNHLQITGSTHTPRRHLDRSTLLRRDRAARHEVIAGGRGVGRRIAEARW